MPLLSQEIIDSAIGNYIITCRNVMFKELSLVDMDDMEVIAKTWGLQLICEGIVIREFIVGSKMINCYFENESQLSLSSNENKMLRTFYLTKKDSADEEN